MSYNHIKLLVREVYNQVHDLTLTHVSKRSPSNFEKISLEILGLPIQRVGVKKKNGSAGESL